MKKVITLFFAIGVALTSFGAPKAMKFMPKQAATLPTSQKHVEVSNAMLPTSLMMKNGQLASQLVAQEVDTFDATYYAPYSLYLYSPYGSIPYYRLIMSPLMDSVPFLCPYGAATWSEDGDVKASSTVTYVQETGDFGGDYIMPTVSVPDTTIGSIVYKFNDYTYGKDWVDLIKVEYSEYAQYFNNFHAMAWPFAWPLSQCGGIGNKYWTKDSKGEAYESADDLWYWSGYDYGDYMFGTGLTNPNKAGRTIDTLGVLVNNISPLWMDTAYLNIMSKSDSIAWAADDTLKLTIYAAKYNKSTKSYDILRDSIYGVAYAGIGDLEYTYGSYGYYWLAELSFSFEKADVLGVVKPTPAVPYGMFWAELTGFENLEAEFGIWADGSQMNLGTFYIVDGKLTEEFEITYQEKKTYLGGHNIMLGFNAYWPSISFEEDTIYIPLSGGEAMYSDGTPAYFYSSESIDDIEVYSKPDWLSIEMDDSEWEKEWYINAGITANASEEIREGKVTLINNYGNYTIVNVKQCEFSAGLEDVLANTKNGGIRKMVVDGQLVIIRNGETFNAQGTKLK